MRPADFVAWEPVSDGVLLMDLRSGDVFRLMGAAATGLLTCVDGAELSPSQLAALAPLRQIGFLV